MTYLAPPNGKNLSTWQDEGEYWFRRVDEILDTADIRKGNGETAALNDPGSADPYKDIPVMVDGVEYAVQEIIEETHTDGWMVLHGTEVTCEQYPDIHPYSGQMKDDTRHLLMSVTKSLTGTIAGILEHDEQVLNTAEDVDYYVPELDESGYKGVSVRDVLDMRSPVIFSEEYVRDESEVKQMEAASGWMPRKNSKWERNTQDFLRSLGAELPPTNGKRFEYRSCEAAVIGWVCERAYQKAKGKFKPFHELVSELLWSKLGVEHDAYVSVDTNGTGAFDGGICATLRDLARFGAMICRDGRSLPTGSNPAGKQVVSQAWVEDIFTNTDTRQAFKENPNYGKMKMDNGKYRSLFWSPTDDLRVVVCIGVYGQMVYINRKTGVVGVKLSSCETAVAEDDPKRGVEGDKGGAWGNGRLAFEMFRAIDDHLSTTGQQPAAATAAG